MPALKRRFTYWSTARAISQRRRLSVEVGGRVSEVHAAEGDMKKKGDLLAVLSDPELDRQVDGAQADFLSAQEGLRQAEASRIRHLVFVSRHRRPTYSL